eukprot:3781699-Amphidinium_carterae.1
MVIRSPGVLPCGRSSTSRDHAQGAGSNYSSHSASSGSRTESQHSKLRSVDEGNDLKVWRLYNEEYELLIATIRRWKRDLRMYEQQSGNKAAESVKTTKMNVEAEKRY